jgi:hypothetical protein
VIFLSAVDLPCKSFHKFPLVKFFKNTSAKLLEICALHNATRHRTKIFIGKIQTKRLATPEADESGNGGEDGRGATIREKGNDRAYNGKFNAGSRFHPGQRCHDWSITRCGVNFAMRDADDRTIVIVVRNGTAV